MNIEIRTASRYSGKTILTIMTAAILRAKSNRDVIIVTDDHDQYNKYFRTCKNFTEDFLRNDSTKSLMIEEEKDFTNEFKSYCLSLTEGIYFLSILNEDAKINLVRNMVKSKSYFLYDLAENAMIPIKYMLSKMIVYNPEITKRNECARYINKLPDIDKKLITVICNRSDRNKVNLNNEAIELGIRKSQLQYIPEIFDLEFLAHNEKLIEFVYKVMNKEPNHVQYYNQLTNIYKAVTMKED